jgi:hypothetical protein
MKKIIKIISALIVLVALFFLAQLLYQIDKIKLTINSDQNNTTIYINGNKINSNSTYLYPGKYQISAISDGYYEYRDLITIDKDSKQKDIKISFIKKPDQTIYYLLKTDHDNVIKKYPILTNLPYNNPFINITYSDDSTFNSLTLVVDSYNGYRSAVINKIKLMGYNPADYNIIFSDYENPFKL